MISSTKPGPGVTKLEWIAKMNDDAIVFPLANPVPEISPDEAKKAGAKIVATGRSDYPIRINNVLGFLGIFRGAPDVRVRAIIDTMIIEAAKAIASVVSEGELREDYIIPSPSKSEGLCQRGQSRRRAGYEGRSRKKKDKQRMG